MSATAPSSASPRTAATGLGLKELWALLVIALIGGSMSGLGYRALRDADALRQEEILSAAVNKVLSSVELELIRTAEAARSASLMLEQKPQLQRAEFNRYAQGLTEQLPSVKVMEWQPLLAAAERARFEQEARAQGLGDFRVVEPDVNTGHWLPAPARDHYLPVLYSWPETNAAWGFNLAADELRMRSKLQSAQLGLPVASESFRVLRGDIPGSQAFGFSITTPVYWDHEPGSLPPQRRLRGYLALVIELPPLLQQASELASAAHLDLRVFDPAMALDKAIYSSPSVGANAVQASAAQKQDRVRTIHVAQRSWQLRLQPRPEFFAALPPSPAAWVLAAGLLFTLLLMVATARTLQDRRRLQQAQLSLMDEHQRLQNVIDGTQAGSWEYNFQTQEIRVNKRWAEIGGLDLAEFRARKNYRWQDDCHPDELARIEQALHQHLRGETPAYTVEYRRRHAQLGWVWVSNTGQVLQRDAQGRALLIAGAMVEIEDRKQAEARILELNNTLEQRVAQRGAELEEAMQKLRMAREDLVRSEAKATLNTLVAGVSHELSTPMSNGLIGASTLAALAKEFQHNVLNGKALRRSDLTQFLSQMIEGSELAARNMERAVDLLKGFRQVATDQASEQRRSFDLRQVLQELLDALAPGLKRHQREKIHIQLDVPEGMVFDSYPGPLEQVLTNLINNAYLHAFEGLEQGGELRISAEWAGTDHVLIQCRDNGRGMDEATLAQLFTPFFSTKIGRGGSGLGMSIVDNLVNKTLGGVVKIESAPGRGCTVFITLPLLAPRPKT